MNIKEINPHLRFVNVINFTPLQRYCRAADCHFFYMHEEACPMYIDGTRYEPESGAVVIVPAGTPYYFEHSGLLRLISINFDYTSSASHRDETMPPVVTEEFCESDITERPSFEDHPFLNSPIVIENMGYIRRHLDTILEEYTYKKQFYREIASSEFRHVLFEVIRGILCERKNSESIDVVLSYIHEHFAEDISNSELSSLVGYHPYHLNRLMKSSTGTTLHSYLIGYRLERAKRYLQETDMSISEIAELCGYRNFSNFSNDFKKKTGYSPVKYRAAVKHMI